MKHDYKGRPIVCDPANADRLGRMMKSVLNGEPFNDGMAALLTVICDVILAAKPDLSAEEYAGAVDAIAPDMKFYLEACVRMRDVGGRPQ